MWVVENVIIIKPIKHRSHYYWCNFNFEANPKKIDRKVWKSQIQPLQEKTGFDLSGYKGINKLKLLRNCVEPEEGLFIFESALRNLSPTSHTLNPTDSIPTGEFNMGDKVSATPTPKLHAKSETHATSHHPNIKSNLNGGLHRHESETKSGFNLTR